MIVMHTQGGMGILLHGPPLHPFRQRLGFTGPDSTFGGPDDTGVAPDEGLALIEPGDLREWWFRRLFLNDQPKGTSGLARRLNPDAFYIAMRWKDHGITNEIARRAIFKITNPIRNKKVFAQGADFGPAKFTHRIVDVSPGVADTIGAATDDIVTVSMIT